MRRILITVIASLLGISLFTGNAFSAGILDEILHKGVIKIGMCMDVPPVKFRDKANKPAGICVDFSKAIARDLGVKLEFVYTDWAGLIPTLLSKRSDIIVTDMSTTLERAKKVLFTDPWMVTGTFIVVKSDSQWKSWKDMNKKGVKIGCILGTIGEENVREVLPDATPITYGSNVEQKLALEQERIDGLANDEMLARREIRVSKVELRLLPGALETDTLAFTVRPEDLHLWIWLNLWFKHIKASGEYDKLMNYWMYTIDWEKDY